MIAIHPHTDCINFMHFSPDGRFFASASEDGWLKVWAADRLHTGEPVWQVNAEADPGSEDAGPRFYSHGLSHVVWTPDGRQVITSGWHRHVHAWDATTGAHRWEVRKPAGFGGVGVLAIAPDGRHLALAGGQMGFPERVYIVDLGEREIVRSVRGHADACGALAAGPDGFASGGADKHVRFWSWKSARCRHDLLLRGIVRGLVFAPDGARFAAAGGSVVMVWDMEPPARGRGPRKPGAVRHFRGHDGQVQCLSFSPDGARLASAAHDGTVRTWDVASGAELRAFAPKVGPLHHVSYAPDGLTLLFGSEKGHVGLIDVGD